MAYGEMPIEYYTENGREIPGPTYHSSEMGDWDEGDREAARLAMDNHAHQENQALRQKNSMLQEHNDRLQEHIERLSMSMPEHLTSLAAQTPEQRRAYRRS